MATYLEDLIRNKIGAEQIQGKRGFDYKDWSPNNIRGIHVLDDIVLIERFVHPAGSPFLVSSIDMSKANTDHLRLSDKALRGVKIGIVDPFKNILFDTKEFRNLEELTLCERWGGLVDPKTQQPLGRSLFPNLPQIVERYKGKRFRGMNLGVVSSVRIPIQDIQSARHKDLNSTFIEVLAKTSQGLGGELRAHVIPGDAKDDWREKIHLTPITYPLDVKGGPLEKKLREYLGSVKEEKVEPEDNVAQIHKQKLALDEAIGHFINYAEQRLHFIATETDELKNPVGVVPFGSVINYVKGDNLEYYLPSGDFTKEKYGLLKSLIFKPGKNIGSGKQSYFEGVLEKAVGGILELEMAHFRRELAEKDKGYGKTIEDVSNKLTQEGLITSETLKKFVEKYPYYSELDSKLLEVLCQVALIWDTWKGLEVKRPLSVHEAKLKLDEEQSDVLKAIESWFEWISETTDELKKPYEVRHFALVRDLLDDLGSVCGSEDGSRYALKMLSFPELRSLAFDPIPLSEVTDPETPYFTEKVINEFIKGLYNLENRHFLHREVDWDVVVPLGIEEYAWMEDFVEEFRNISTQESEINKKTLQESPWIAKLPGEWKKVYLESRFAKEAYRMFKNGELKQDNYDWVPDWLTEDTFAPLKEVMAVQESGKISKAISTLMDTLLQNQTAPIPGGYGALKHKGISKEVIDRLVAYKYITSDNEQNPGVFNEEAWSCMEKITKEKKLMSMVKVFLPYDQPGTFNSITELLKSIR